MRMLPLNQMLASIYEVSFNQSPPNKISFSWSVNWSTQCTDFEVLSFCNLIWPKSTGLPQIFSFFFCRKRKATHLACWLEQREDFHMEEAEVVRAPSRLQKVVACWVWQGAVCHLEEVAGATPRLQEVEACCVEEEVARRLDEVASWWLAEVVAGCLWEGAVCCLKKVVVCFLGDVFVIPTIGEGGSDILTKNSGQ